MFEPISVITSMYLGYTVLAGYAQRTSAISGEARQVAEAASRVMRDRERSQSLFGAKALALSQLRAAVVDLIVDDDQEAIRPNALYNAEQFLLALPDDLPAPHVAIDPDGEISLTWAASRVRMFSVSVAESERLAYAWVDGSDRGHAVARFRAPVVPAGLFAHLRSFVTNDGAFLRAA